MSYVSAARATTQTSDERVVTVQLTDKGRALRAELAPVREQVAELAGIHDDAHRRRLIAELQELTALLQAGTSPASD